MFSRDLDLTPDQLGAAIPLWSKLIRDALAVLERFGGRGFRSCAGRSTRRPIRTPLLKRRRRFAGRIEKFWESFRAYERVLMDLLTPRQQALYILADAEHPRRAARIYRALRQMDGSSERRSPPLSDRR